MYNYFMLIGTVEGYDYGQTFDIKLRVAKKFGQGQGDNHFEIKIIDGYWIENAKQVVEYGKKIVVKGRINQLENRLELIGERIISLSM